MGLLEPSLSAGEGRELLVQNLLTARSVKPNIGPIEKSSALKQVRSFLPRMAEAEAKLAKDIEQGLKERINIENVQNDERVIEMNIGLLENMNSESWTSDSEPDSIPSSPDNNYTSDTEESSSSSSSASSSDVEKKPVSKIPASSPSQSSRCRPRKRPLIEVLDTEKCKDGMKGVAD